MARLATPIRLGVPLPVGLVPAASVASVVDGDRHLPAQVRVVSRWPDGSARWVLADFQTALAASESRSVQLQFTAAPTAAPRLHLERTPVGLHIDTGALQFVVPDDGTTLLQDVGPPGAKQPTQLRAFAEIDGQRHTGKVQRVEVLEQGPLRVRLALHGNYGGGFVFVLRLDVFAGRPELQLLHSFENRGSARTASLGELRLELSLADGPVRYRSGVTGQPPPVGDLVSGRWAVEQLDAASITIDGKPKHGRSQGWVHTQAGGMGIAVAAPFFWQEYPQSFEVRPGALRYFLRSRADRPALVGVGAAKTHALTLHFDAGTVPSDASLAALAQPVVAWADPAWTAASGALRNALPHSPAAAAFLDKLQRSFLRYRQTQDRETWDDSDRTTCSPGAGRKRVGAYGMFNWGDWNFPGYRDDVKGCDAWGNLEYDTTQVLALAFAASGDPDLFTSMTASARHFMDVDRIHHDPRRPGWVGMHHPKNPLHFTFELGGVDLGHVWNEGLVTYGLLTGDERALRAATEIADYLVRRSRDGIHFRGNPRQWGWPQIALVAAFELTGESSYRDAALVYARRGMQTHAADALEAWKVGILAEALAYTYNVSGDSEIETWLQRYRAAVLAKSPPDARYYPALAMAAEDTASRQRAERAVAALQFGVWGKPLTIAGRTGLAILGSKPGRRSNPPQSTP